MESTLSKHTSVRCDMHPPLSAIMFCDNCAAFLCKLCAEARPGGRVCVNCKKPCRSADPDEIPRLLALREKARETARQAKAAVGKIKEASERAKEDREARLKAEFAAKKAEWKKKTAAVALAGGSENLSLVPVSGTNRLPVAVVPLPAQSTTKFEDPLYKLGERGHLAVIGRARNKILWVAILSMVFNGFAYVLIAGAGTMADLLQTAHEAAVARRESEVPSKSKLSPVEREKLIAQQREADEVAEGAFIKVRWSLFWGKLIMFAFFAVGVALFILYFRCEEFPKESTAWAFNIYVGAIAGSAILDLLASGGISLLVVAIRALLAYGLYQGKVAGAELQKMRDDERQWLAAKSARPA